MPRNWISIGPGRYVAEEAVVRYDCPHPKTLILHTTVGRIDLPPEDDPELNLGNIIKVLRGESGKETKIKVRK